MLIIHIAEWYIFLELLVYEVKLSIYAFLKIEDVVRIKIYTKSKVPLNLEIGDIENSISPENRLPLYKISPAVKENKIYSKEKIIPHIPNDNNILFLVKETLSDKINNKLSKKMINENNKIINKLGLNSKFLNSIKTSILVKFEI